MISEWNINMENVLIPSWISCLDESMSIWFGRFTCPGSVLSQESLTPVEMNTIPFVAD